jgi:hypothetical protein
MISMEEVMQLRVKLLSSTALAAVAALGVSSASAQDIGALSKRVEALEKAGGGQYIARSKKTVNLVISGHVNQMMQFRDNGQNSAVQFSGNGESETRFRFVGTGKLSDDISTKTTIEVGDNSSSNQLIDSDNLTNDQGNFVIRQMYISLSSKSMGALSFGDFSLSTDGYHGKADMSGTGLVQTAGNAMIGAEPFKNSATGANSGLTGAGFSNLDAGRTDHIQYDTPSFAGFQGTVSLANEDDHNFGLSYGGDFGGVKVKAAVAYDAIKHGNGAGAGNTETDTVNGSVGVLLPMGLSFVVGAADRNAEPTSGTTGGGNDQDRLYLKLGYMFTASELGQTRIGLDYSENNVDNATNDEFKRWSLGVVQVVEPLGAEVYAAYHNFSADRTGVSTDDIDVVTAGMRISF